MCVNCVLSVAIAIACQPASGGGPEQRELEALRREARHLANVTQLTFDGAGERGFVRAGEGYFSPDGKTIIFQAVRGRNPFFQIYTLELATGRVRLVSTGRGKCTCAFFRPDGNKIIFASSHLDPDAAAKEAAEQRRLEKQRHRRGRYKWEFEPYMDIFQADPDGSNLQRLTTTAGYDAECAYSPDGKRIVFCSTRDGDPDIYVMDADGSNVRQLTDAPGYDGGPFFSPDGNYIIFRSDRRKPDLLQLYIMRADGSQQRALTENEGVNWCPYWHPSGRYIIYSFADYSQPHRRPNFDLYLMELKSRRSTRITWSTAADVLPAFSPDGSKLLWTSKRRFGCKGSQLFLADFFLQPCDRTRSKPPSKPGSTPHE